MRDLEQELAELKAKYDTRITRKACLVVGVVCFVLGFLAKAMIF